MTTSTPKDANQSEEAFRALVRVLEEAVQAGVDSVELEWEGRNLFVFQCLGHAAVGTAPFPRELQGPVLEELVKRAGLGDKPRRKMLVTLLGEKYEVPVKEYENFGESAFVLKLKKPGKKNRPTR
jgi:hypothetical protein